MNNRIKTLKKRNFKSAHENSTININSNTKFKDVLFNNVIITATDVVNINFDKCVFIGCRLLLKNVKNLCLNNNSFVKPYLVKNDPTYVNYKGEQAKYARGMELVDCDVVKVENNELLECLGEAIYIENIKKNPYNIIIKNTVELSSSDTVDTNLEASIFVRNNKNGHLTITENTIKNNLLNPNQINRCDGIEINLNRTKNYSNNILVQSNVLTTLNVNITKNKILNLRGSTNGIDINAGNNSILNLNILENTVSNVGNEALTLDSYGNLVKINSTIENNYFNTNGSNKIIFLTLNDTYESKYFGQWEYKANEIINYNKNNIYIKVLAGDFLFPNKYSSILNGYEMALSINIVDFDVIGVGNHEFDGGKDSLKTLTQTLSQSLICSNLKEEDLLEYNLVSNISFTKKNIKFGAIAYVTQETSFISSVDIKNINFLNLDYVLDKNKSFLEKHDVRILSFHEDIQVILDYFKKNPKKLNLIDVIVTGHQHIKFTDTIKNDYKIVPIIQMGEDASGLGKIEFNYENNNLNYLSNTVIEIEKDTPQYPEIQNISDWVYDLTKDSFEKDIAIIKNFSLDGIKSNLRSKETNMGDFFVDSYLYWARQLQLQLVPNNIFCIANSGSIRSTRVYEIDELVDGNTIYTITPFNNNLILLELVGRKAVNDLINKLAIKSLSKKGSGGFLQISSNLRFNYVNKKYELLGGSENETDIFYLVVTEFIANGGDGYNELKTLKKIEVNEPVQNATIQYINSLPKDGELGKIVQPNTQTRIIQ